MSVFDDVADETDVDDDELTLDLDQAPEPETPTEPEKPAEPDLKAIMARVDELAARPTSDPAMGELVALAKQFFANSNRPAPVSAEQAEKQRADMLARLAENPESTMRSMLEGMLAERAAPIVANLGETAIERFLDRQEKELANNPKMFQAVQKVFDGLISDEQRAALGQADPKLRRQFLADRWDAATGKVFSQARTSRSNAPRDISGGSGSGASGGRGKEYSLPGVSDRENREFRKLAEASARNRYPTDPAKQKEYAAKLMAEAVASVTGA